MATMIAPTRWRQIVLVDRATLPLLTPLGDAGDRTRYRLSEEPAVRVEVRGRLAEAIDHELEAHIIFDADPGDGPAAALAGLPTPRVDLDVDRRPATAPVVPPLVLSGLLRRLTVDARERLADETGPHRPRTYGRHRDP